LTIEFDGIDFDLGLPLSVVVADVDVGIGDDFYPGLE
jgi:hypothetical protein